MAFGDIRESAERLAAGNRSLKFAKRRHGGTTGDDISQAGNHLVSMTWRAAQP